jgi:hypothetical protein
MQRFNSPGSLSNDSKFEEKFWDVIGLYLDPPEKALVLCWDERGASVRRSSVRNLACRWRCDTRAHDRTTPAPWHCDALCGTRLSRRQADLAHGTAAGGLGLPTAGEKERRGQQVLQVRPCCRNPPKVLDGHHVLDPRARTSDCRRRSAAQRVQDFLLCGVGGLICVSVRFRRERNIIKSAKPAPVVLDCAKCRVEGLIAFITHLSRIGLGFLPRLRYSTNETGVNSLFCDRVAI